MFQNKLLRPGQQSGQAVFQNKADHKAWKEKQASSNIVKRNLLLYNKIVM